MHPALGQICTLDSPFEQDIEQYSASECTAVEAWFTKLEQFLDGRSTADVGGLLNRHGVEIPVASLQGGLLSSQGEARRLAWDLFRRRLELCRELQIPTVVVACDVPGPLQQVDIDRVRHSLVETAQVAGRHGVRVALEFQSAAALGNNLQTGVALVEEVASPHLGLCLDLFHYHTGPSKPEDLGYLTAENLFHVQLCDLADIPRELASDSDRILPGDGDIAIEPVVQRLREIGYQGHVALEVMNPQLWQVPARQFSEIGMSALARYLS